MGRISTTNCIIILSLVLCLAAICSAQSGGTQNQSDLERSAARYQEQLQRSPDRADLWRKLGTAYYQLNRPDDALKAFEKASDLDPSDGTSLVYEGMIYEQKNDLDRAGKRYADYLALNKNDKLSEQIKYRLRWIEDNRLKQLVDDAVANENKVKIDNILKNSVAVVRFSSDSLSEKLKPLGRGIAELIYNDLSYVPDLKLVERLELPRLQDELKLSQSEFTDKFTAPRIGKILGAAKIVTGQITETSGGVGIDCGIIDVGPGLAEYPGGEQGKLNDIFAMQKKLTLSIIDKLGYKITPAIKNKIDKSPTESYLALMAYSRGLDYADRGLYPQAENEFKTALSEDPNFSLAKQSYDRYSGLSNYDGTLKPLSTVSSLMTTETSSEEKQQSDLGDIMKRLEDAPRGVVPADDTPTPTPKTSGGKVVVTGRTER